MQTLCVPQSIRQTVDVASGEVCLALECRERAALSRQLENEVKRIYGLAIERLQALPAVEDVSGGGGIPFMSGSIARLTVTRTFMLLSLSTVAFQGDPDARSPRFHTV